MRETREICVVCGAIGDARDDHGRCLGCHRTSDTETQIRTTAEGWVSETDITAGEPTMEILSTWSEDDGMGSALCVWLVRATSKADAEEAAHPYLNGCLHDYDCCGCWNYNLPKAIKIDHDLWTVTQICYMNI